MSAKRINTDGLNPDKPICQKGQDQLGRYPLATRIADLINDLSDGYEDSIVIGIEGEWGAGKSSFIKLILGLINPEFSKSNAQDGSVEQNMDVMANEHNVVMEFNPWNFSNQNELIKDFFGSIATRMEQIYKKDTNWWIRFGNRISELFRRQNIAKMIGGYALKLLEHSEIELAPTVSLVGILNFRFKAVWNFRRGNERSLEYQRNEIIKKFENIGKRIIIVIDDIDRLDSDETKLIFKLVKLATNFPNTVFFLAYDRDKVGKRMDEKGANDEEVGIKGEEYLKKIVQLSFLMPKPDPGDIFKILTSSISKELESVGFSAEDTNERRLRKLIASLEFRKFFRTVRDIRRYTNSLRLDLKIIDKGEINMGDFCGIEAIRVFVPEVYLAMTNESRIFTKMYESFNSDESRKENRRKYITSIIEKAPEELRNSVQKIIFHLFPQVEGLLGSGPEYSKEFLKDWRKARRVCVQEMFDRYFSLSVPPSTLSESEFRDFLSAMNNVLAISGKLKKLASQGKLRPISAKLLDYLDDLNDQQRENMLICIFDLAEEVMDSKQGVFDFDDFDTQAGRIGYQTLKRIEKSKRGILLVKLIDVTQSLFVMSGLILALDEEAETYAKKGAEEPLLTEKEMVTVNRAYVEKTKAAAQDGSLVTKKKWRYALRNWKKWGVKGEAETYVKKLQRTDDSLFTLLRGFISVGTTEAEGEVEKISRIDRDHLGDFLDLDELDKRVDEFDVNGLKEEDAKIVILYKNPPKDPRGRS